MRWAEGERGVRRARAPVWVVRRIGVGVGLEGDGERRRVMVEG